MAVKANNEETAGAVTAEQNKKNNLFAIAVGLAGASLLLSAGTAFATVVHDKGSDVRGGFSHGEQDSRGGMMSQDGVQLQQGFGGKHRGGQDAQQGGVQSNSSQTAPDGTQMPMMQFDAKSGNSN